MATGGQPPLPSSSRQPRGSRHHCHLLESKRPRFRMPEAVFRSQPAHPVRGAGVSGLPSGYVQPFHLDQLAITSAFADPEVQGGDPRADLGRSRCRDSGWLVDHVTASKPVRPFVVRRVKVCITDSVARSRLRPDGPSLAVSVVSGSRGQRQKRSAPVTVCTRATLETLPSHASCMPSCTSASLPPAQGTPDTNHPAASVVSGCTSLQSKLGQRSAYIRSPLATVCTRATLETIPSHASCMPSCTSASLPPA